MKKYVHENTSLIKPLSKLLDADKKKTGIQDTIFHFSLLFLSSVSKELRAVTCGHSCLDFTPTALINISILLFFFAVVFAVLPEWMSLWTS